MKIIKMILCLFLVLHIANVFKSQSSQIIPVELSDVSPTIAKLKSIDVKPTEKLVKAIDFASDQHDISPEFIIALTSTESDFNEKAISSKGYKGLMQIPQAVYYPDANILIGVRIFKEKMIETKNDVLKAIILYKGYPIGSPRGILLAKKVMTLYNQLKEV